MRYSIIIPMYNVAGYIAKTLKSFTKEAMRDTELILVDDGSVDDSASVASEYLVTAGISSFRVITKGNGGVSTARNAGLDAARGEYIIFCDADDCLGEAQQDCSCDFAGLANRLNECDEDLIAWPFYNYQDGVLSSSLSESMVRPKGVCSRNQFLRFNLLQGFKSRLGAFAVKRSLIEKYQFRFDTSCTLGEDVEFFMKVFMRADSVRVLEQPYYIYNKHMGSLAYSYNIRRFEAPLAMGRVSEYMKTHEDVAESIDADVKEYIDNGLYILHGIYAFDSCIARLGGIGPKRQLWKDYITNYLQVEKQLKMKLSAMNTAPFGISRKRLLLFGLSRRLYILMRK